jgi:hypothetical protein
VLALLIGGWHGVKTLHKLGKRTVPGLFSFGRKNASRKLPVLKVVSDTFATLTSSRAGSVSTGTARFIEFQIALDNVFHNNPSFIHNQYLKIGRQVCTTGYACPRMNPLVWGRP